ncbi:MAG: 16S rRNA (guanine(966)-N(2))-methyltransferase RsmD [Lachnospiraceae bacterium]|nr:16S rRNA (guanine(966)-N(2))-methyltransferase RsmD [Lachnospiraceae bacterium]
MRVIAGEARSLQLVTPEGEDTRPTTDRIKETLFNMIQFDIPGCKFLDLFAGSGGIGIEALSRGAEKAVFVDSAKEAQACIEQNLEHTHFTDKAQLLKQDAFVSMMMLEYREVFDIVFMDPPYHKELERRVLEYLSTSPIINADTLVIFEAAVDTDISYIDQLPFTITKVKKYKNNMHVFLKKDVAE